MTCRRRIQPVVPIVVCAAVLAGCGGGGSPGSSALPSHAQRQASSTQPTQAAQGNVRFVIRVARRAASGRSAPRYFAIGTASLQIWTDGRNPVIVNLNLPSDYCVGSGVCVASVQAHTGDHVFTVTTYDALDARGNVLSTNSTGPVYVAPSGPTNVALTLEGVVHSVHLTLATVNPPVGTAAEIGLTATLWDADQNLIVGPAPFENPVTLTSTNSVAGALSKTVLNSPADTAALTVNYSGRTSLPSPTLRLQPVSQAPTPNALARECAASISARPTSGGR